MRTLAAGVFAVLASAVPALSGAQVVPLGSEFQVNTYTTSDQYFPAIASDGAGNFIVVWDRERWGRDVSGQRYASTGAALGGEFQVNTHTTTRDPWPAVASDGAGNFIVVWDACGGDPADPCGVFGQRYASTGAALGTEFQVYTYATGSQGAPAVASDLAGNFVVVSERWQVGSSYGVGVLGQRFDSTGMALGPEFQVNTHTTNDTELPDVASDAEGNFLVVWMEYVGPGAKDYDTFARLYDSTGMALGPEFQVNTFTPNRQWYPAVASDAAGNFVVVWASEGPDWENFGIFGQRYDSTGAALGTEFRASAYVPPEQQQQSPDVASDEEGNFVVVWETQLTDDRQYEIFGQRFDSTGMPLSSESHLNTYTTNYQRFPKVASDAAGNFVVVWQSWGQDGDGYGIFGQRFGVQTGPCIGPVVGCRTAEKSLLLFKNDASDDAKDKLLWKWLKGEATSQQGFADPTDTAEYALCLYAGTTGTLVAEATVPPDPVKWQPISTKGYKYKDGTGTADGVQKIVLKGSTENKAKALVKGKGANLPMPDLPLALPVTAQLVNSDTGICWEGVYDTGDVKKNEESQFKARVTSP